MLFDVQAALAEITGVSPATLATKRQNVVEVADVAVGAREILAPATPPGGAVVLPRHDPAARPAPAPSAPGSMVRLVWSGEWVSHDRWGAMTELERHGPRGVLFCGECWRPRSREVALACLDGRPCP